MHTLVGARAGTGAAPGRPAAPISKCTRQLHCCALHLPETPQLAAQLPARYVLGTADGNAWYRVVRL